MNSQKNAILIVGSFRRKRSASEFIGDFLLKELHEKGFLTEKVYTVDLLNSERMVDSFLIKIDNSDIVIISAPLYIDCEPYSVIKAMENIANHRKIANNVKVPQFLAISNGGYPEPHHSDTAIDIYRCFAKEAGFNWAGGLTFGMGAALTVPVLKSLWAIPFNNALKFVAKTLAEGKPIPSVYISRIRKTIIPIWMYSFLARSVARFFSLTNGSWDIYKRPAST